MPESLTGAYGRNHEHIRSGRGDEAYATLRLHPLPEAHTQR